MGIWEPERNREQGQLVASMYEPARDVPCDWRAFVVGGLPGADKAIRLRVSGVDPSCYLTISVDLILRQMAARGLIPAIAGRTPMDAADLVHAEAQFLVKRAGLRAMADGRNLIWDITMAYPYAAYALLEILRGAGYWAEHSFADLPAEESIRHADAAHRRGHDEYRAGRGCGGRYIPAEAIRALTLPPWPRYGRNTTMGEWLMLRSARFRAGDRAAFDQLRAERRFPGGEVTEMIAAYNAGEIRLADLADQFRRRHWPANRSACPPELPAAPAVDDPEPYVPGSFDDVVLAYDLGKLSDHDYQVLATAARASASPAG